MLNDLSLAAWIRGRRAQKAQTQAEAAVLIGTSTSVIARWERGEVPAKIVDIVGLARWAGVEETDVFLRISRDLAATTAA